MVGRGGGLERVAHHCVGQDPLKPPNKKYKTKLIDIRYPSKSGACLARSSLLMQFIILNADMFKLLVPCFGIIAFFKKQKTKNKTKTRAKERKKATRKE